MFINNLFENDNDKNNSDKTVTEGLPGSLSKSDYTPGKTVKHTDTNCTTCHGRKVMYQLDSKLFADNKKGATKVKCPTCKGTGDKQGVAEGSEQKFKVSYEIHGSNKEKPLYTNTRTVTARSEKEAIDTIRKLVGGRNHRVEKVVGEAGPFSYGAKKPRKGSLKHQMAQQSKKYWDQQPVIEPKDQMVGNARVIKNVKENAEDLNVGDPVIITGNVQFNGATGEIDSFGRDKRFVVVNLYNHGRHSFHSSDVSYNDYADSDDEDARAYDNDPEYKNWVDRQGLDEAGGIDSVTLDIPLLIRLLEYAREDANDDIDLHHVTEKLIVLAQKGGMLSMNDYDTIVSKLSESFNMSKEFAAKRLLEHHEFAASLKEAKQSQHTYRLKFDDGTEDTMYTVHDPSTPATDTEVRNMAVKQHPGRKIKSIVKTGRAEVTHEAVESYLDELKRAGYDLLDEEKQRLDPKCWKGYRKAGTKMKGGVRVNNCVPIKKKK